MGEPTSRELAEVEHHDLPEITYAEPGTLQPIDIASEKAWLDSFRSFIDTVLDESMGHFGKMEGVKKNFLHQPGAEIIFRALKCRDEAQIISEHIDYEADFCLFAYRIEVVHIATGNVMGSGDGAATSGEYASSCYYIEAQPQAKDPFMDCPVHGRHPARTWYDKGKNRRMKACAKKVSKPLSQTLHNTMAKARKRAYVAAIRHVGCVSERFTSEEELVGNQPDVDDVPPPLTSDAATGSAKCKPGPDGEACVKPAGHAGEHRTAKGLGYGTPPAAAATPKAPETEQRPEPATSNDVEKPEPPAVDYDLDQVISLITILMAGSKPPFEIDHLRLLGGWPEGATMKDGVAHLLNGQTGTEMELATGLMAAVAALTKDE